MVFQQPPTPPPFFSKLEFLRAVLSGETLENEESSARKRRRFRVFTVAYPSGEAAASDRSLVRMLRTGE
jgi:hypothetical protein